MAKYEIEKLKGVMPASLTIFDENEEIDEARTKSFVNYLINTGINGLYLTGSTGEAFLMDLQERKRFVEIVIEEVAGRVPIIVHIGAIGTKNSIELAQHAYQAGADAISSVPPFYWSFSEEDIFNYYRDIAEAVPMPMIIYNVPLSGLLAFDVIKKIACIENVKGIKYTATTHNQIAMIKDQIGKDFLVFSGCDEMATSGLINGADGVIGSFLNLMPELFLGIYQSINNNDIVTARVKQQDVVRIIDYSLHYNYFSVIRLGLKWMGVDVGYSRRPFKNYDSNEEKMIKKGFLELREKYQIKRVKFLDSLTL